MNELITRAKLMVDTICKVNGTQNVERFKQLIHACCGDDRELIVVWLDVMFAIRHVRLCDIYGVDLSNGNEIKAAMRSAKIEAAEPILARYLEKYGE